MADVLTEDCRPGLWWATQVAALLSAPIRLELHRIQSGRGSICGKGIPLPPSCLHPVSRNNELWVVMENGALTDVIDNNGPWI